MCYTMQVQASVTMTLMWKEQRMEMMETRILLMPTLLAGKRNIKNDKRR
jgi:hypothetical protein